MEDTMEDERDGEHFDGCREEQERRLGTLAGVYAYGVDPASKDGDYSAVFVRRGRVEEPPPHPHRSLPLFQEKVRREQYNLGRQVAEADMINQLSDKVHDANSKWWHDLDSGARLNRNKGEMLALIHSEISECMEGERKDLMDEHLPHRRSAEVELADAMIRILDYAAGWNYDLGGAFVEKMEYNRTREDHTVEARRKPNGKKY